MRPTHVIRDDLYLKSTACRCPPHLQITFTATPPLVFKLQGAIAWPSGHIKLVIKTTVPLSQGWGEILCPAPRDANSSGRKGPGNFLQGMQTILMLIRGWEPVDQMTPRLWAYSSQTRRCGLACTWCQETLISLSCQAPTSRLGQ